MRTAHHGPGHPNKRHGTAAIVRIDNLVGLDRLTVLALDNNNIEKIQNLDHLVNLTWLGTRLLSRGHPRRQPSRVAQTCPLTASKT